MQLSVCRFFVIALLLLGIGVSITDSAYAQPANANRLASMTEWAADLARNSIFREGNFEGKAYTCLYTPPAGISQEDWQDKFSARYIFCMRGILVEATEAILQKVVDYARPAMAAVLVFALAYAGVKALAGMYRNVKAESAIFIGKVVGILLVFANMDVIASLTFDVTDQVLSLVAEGASATFTQGTQCNVIVSPGTYGEWLAVFDRMDCIIGKLVGLGTQSQMITGFMGVMGATFFSGTGGVQLFFFCMGLFIALLTFLLRCTLMVIMAYGALGMLMLCLPLCILTILFKPIESYFFRSWLGYCISNIVQPAVMIGFMMFCFAALDMFIYRGSPTSMFRNINGQTELASYDPQTGQITRNGQAVPNTNGFEPVIVPYYVPLNVDITAPPDVQVEQMARNFRPGERIFNFQLPQDPDFYVAMRSYCGSLGTLVPKYDDILRMAWNTGKGFVQAFTDWHEAKKKALQAAGNRAYNVFKNGAQIFACVWGQGHRFGLTQRSEKRLENSINNAIPKTTKLFLGWNINNGNAANANDLHEKNMQKLRVATIALIILAGTFFTYTGHVSGMARTITGRFGSALSVSGPKLGGQKLSQKVKSGMNRAKGNWSQVAQMKNAPIISKTGLNVPVDMAKEVTRDVLPKGTKKP